MYPRQCCKNYYQLPSKLQFGMTNADLSVNGQDPSQPNVESSEISFACNFES